MDWMDLDPSLGPTTAPCRRDMSTYCINPGRDTINEPVLKSPTSRAGLVHPGQETVAYGNHQTDDGDAKPDEGPMQHTE